MSFGQLSGFAQGHAASPSNSSAEQEFEPRYFYSKLSAFFSSPLTTYASVFAYIIFPRKQTLTRHIVE